MKKVLLLLVSVLLLATSLTIAADMDTKISGTIFANYSWITSQYRQCGLLSNDFNSFDINRARIGAATKFTDDIGSFIQAEGNLSSTDITGNPGHQTPNILFLRQAYVEFTNIYPKGSLQVGLVPTIWVEFEDSLWKNRFVAPTVSEGDIGLNLSDRGVRVMGSFSMVSYEAMLVNGEGTGATNFTGNEVSKHKDIALRVAVSPFETGETKNLKINGYIAQGTISGIVADNKRNRTILGLSYDGSGWNVAGNYYMAETGPTPIKSAGYSVFGNYDLNMSNWILARYDKVDPDTNIDDNGYSRIILGIGHKIIENVRMAIAYNGVTQETEAALDKNQTIISANMEVKF